MQHTDIVRYSAVFIVIELYRDGASREFYQKTLNENLCHHYSLLKKKKKLL